MNVIINLPHILSNALKGRPPLLMPFVDKLPVSVFPAAVGSELNVSSFPFPLSWKVAQTQRDTSILRIGPFPQSLQGLPVSILSLVMPLFRNGMFQRNWETFLEQRGTILRDPMEAAKMKSNWASQRSGPDWKAIGTQGSCSPRGYSSG